MIHSVCGAKTLSGPTLVDRATLDAQTKTRILGFKKKNKKKTMVLKGRPNLIQCVQQTVCIKYRQPQGILTFRGEKIFVRWWTRECWIGRDWQRRQALDWRRTMLLHRSRGTRCKSARNRNSILSGFVSNRFPLFISHNPQGVFLLVRPKND